MQRLPHPERAPADIALWRIDFDLERPVAARDWDCLGIDERARAQGFRRPEDKIRYVQMRAALRRVLGERLACHPHTLRFEQNAFGKPHLAQRRGPAFNLAHAGAFGLLAVSDALEVGVDIEYCDASLADDDIAGIAGQMFSDRESKQWQQDRVGMTPDDFFAHWVGKEAGLKALGVGIGEHLRTLSVLPAGDGAYALSHDHPAWPPVHAHRLDSPPGYAAALAWIYPEVSN
jgi:4'-phosphopantetheinyl transferase